MGIFHLYHMENTAVLCNGPVKKSESSSKKFREKWQARRIY